MDERVLRVVTVLTAILTCAVCGILYYFPEFALKETHPVSSDSVPKEVVEVAEPVIKAEPQVIVEEDDIKAQLQIELPEKLKESELEISNDYLTQTLFVRFKGGVRDYFEEYAIKGKCEHIVSLAYYQEKKYGVVALQLDKVYECTTTFEDGKLYVDFVEPHEIYDKVVVIDAGHGGRMPGATKQGVYEKDIDLSIVLELKKIFDDSDENIGVYYTRTTDVNPSYEQRVQLANKSNADLFISIHNNASASGNYTRTNGTQVLYSESDKTKCSSKRFSEILLERVVKTIESKNMGLVKGDSIYIIRTSEVPVALLEVGFMTNKIELEKLIDEQYQKKVAEGIYQAITDAFKEGF